MISLLATAALSFFSPAPQPAFAATVQSSTDNEGQGPDEATIQATLAELKLAFAKTTDITDRLAAIDRAGQVTSRAVAKALGRGLKDKQLEVVSATLSVLAKMGTDEAFSQLVSFYKRDRRLKKDETLLINALKAIAWRGAPESIEILRENVFNNAGNKIAQTRILGLGRIRTPEAAEAAINLMKSMGRKKIQPYMNDLSLTLTVLTGVDHGKSQDRWISWWNENKRGLEISENQSKLSKPMQRKWDNFWGTRPDKERGKKREERGDDEG